LLIAKKKNCFWVNLISKFGPNNFGKREKKKNRREEEKKIKDSFDCWAFI